MTDPAHLTADLAECCRLATDDPDGDSDAVLARLATTEVRRLRIDHDTLAQRVDKLTEAIRAHHRDRRTIDPADTRLYEVLDPVEEFLSDQS